MSARRTGADRPRKIAVLGNMNNAGFAIMRYLRDLGEDAWLLPFSTDGAGNLSHFAPEADTWDEERWRPFIHPLDIPNTIQAVMSNPLRLRMAPSRARVREALAGFDHIIGSGVAPALLNRIRRPLDIFFPYGIGIEFYGDHLFLAQMKSSMSRRLRYGRLRRQQAEGILAARLCLNAEMSLTRQSFEKIGKPFLKLGIPAVYNRDRRTGANFSPRLRSALGRVAMSDLSLVSAARLLWVRDPAIPADQWPSYTKNSDWLVRGLAKFLEQRPRASPLLTLTEYGKDVEATKKLVAQLGLSRHVQWLPVMHRREIMELLKACHIGVGEFYSDPGLLWGGTGWEVLASGRPLLQAFNFQDGEYFAAFRHEPPPILNAKSPEDVAAQLLNIYDSPEWGRKIGARSSVWFDKHGGIGLTRRWLEALLTSEGPASEYA